MLNSKLFSTKLFLFALVVTLMLPPLLQGQVETDRPFYVIDIQGVLDRSKPGMAAKASIESQAKIRQEKIQQREQDFESKRAQLMKQAALLSEDALMQRSQELEKQQQEIAQMVQEEQQALNQLNMREIGRLVQEIDRIVREISQAENIQVVLEKDPGYVIYANEKYDLTERVISRLNK